LKSPLVYAQNCIKSAPHRFARTSRFSTFVSGISLAVLSFSVTAEEVSTSQSESQMQVTHFNQTPKSPLPNPLSLDYVLEQLPIQSPQLLRQEATVLQRQATLLGQEAIDNWQFDFEGRLSRRDFADQAQDNHRAALHLGKQLYDFGATDGLIVAEQRAMLAEQGLYESLEQAHKLAIMQSFFNVILADFQFRIDNEAMAIEYIQFDKTKDRHEVGEASDVDLIAAESNYQQVLVKRSKSEQRQLSSRVAMANRLGLANARPDELVMPSLKRFNLLDVKKLQLNDLYQQLAEKNPQLQHLNGLWQAQLTRVNALAQSNQPTLRADAWLGQLSSQPELREGNWRADLSVNVPLYDGGQQKSQHLAAKAKLQQLSADYETLTQSLREEVADIYFQLKLLKAEKEMHQLYGDYADLYLDFSRALYENEKSTDLGNSFVRLSQANYNLIEWRFKQALLWSKLDLLLGQPITLNVEQTASQ